MAGEREGQVAEAITLIAAERAVHRLNKSQELFFQRRPDGMSIVPDICIGVELNAPDAIVLVTQAGSHGEAHKKLWRNLGEIIEASSAITPAPKFISVLFGSGYTQSNVQTQAALFDRLLVCSELRSYAETNQWILDNLDSLPTSAVGKRHAVLEALDQGNEHLEQFIGALSTELETALVKDASGLLSSTGSRGSVALRSPRTTYVKRASAKLLIATERAPLWDVYDGKRVLASRFPAFAFELGLVDQFATLATPSDSELASLASLFSSPQQRGQLESYLENFNEPLAKSWVADLRNADKLRAASKYVGDNLVRLLEPKFIYEGLLELQENPEALLDSSTISELGGAPNRIWLYEVLVHVLRLCAGAMNTFGRGHIAKIVRTMDIQEHHFDAGAVKFLQTPYGHVSEWVNRKKKLAPNVIWILASVLALELRNVGEAGLRAKLSEIVPSIIDNLLNLKLVSYEPFDPVGYLILASLPGASTIDVRSCFAEAAELGGQAGNTTVLKAKSTLINWQSCHDSHTNDKKKELCGRAVALRYTWDAASKTFKPRPGVSKLILVLDGTWRQSDLDALLRAGWDEIYYADEMSKLAKAVV